MSSGSAWLARETDRITARAALRHGFETLDLPEIVAFTTAANARSRRVMERLGMRYSPDDDFEQTQLPEGHSLRPHVLYRMTQQRWRELPVAG